MITIIEIQHFVKTVHFLVVLQPTYAKCWQTGCKKQQC